MTDQEIEASVIDGLLLGGYTPDAADVLATLDEDAFTASLYRETFREIRRQAKTRGLIDGLMVGEAMGSGNFGAVMKTVKKCPSAANLKGYARLLADYQRVRRFTALLGDGLEQVRQSPNHERALAVMGQVLASLRDIDCSADEVRPMHIDELIDPYTELLEKHLKNGEASDSLKTGIDELDEILGGINPVDLVIVAARPGMGKTEFALKVAEGVAAQHTTRQIDTENGAITEIERKGVLIFSMEMDAMQVIERSLAGASHLPVSTLRKPCRMDDEGWARVSEGLRRLQGLDVWVVDASSLTIEQIRAISYRHKLTHPALSLIMVDYLGLIEKPLAERNDLAIAHISGSLKRMAKELKTPVMSLSQLSRNVEQHPNKWPTCADLRDSGSIEQDADSIIMLYRDAVYNENSPAAKYAELIVTKNRFGTQGTAYQEFKNGHFMPTNQEQAASACQNNANVAPMKRYASGAAV
ncbi:MAG: replicative DNA helicase [Sodalis sp. (in: enterobacteria)]|uniref:replicative DNA helicase n=1 Tax=Sodalis sp. (in: enterobacteria) TaxID=1898979 RepID=UPI0039E34700